MAATFMWSRKRKTLEGIDPEKICKYGFFFNEKYVIPVQFYKY
jgi:hypothetical protein